MHWIHGWGCILLLVQNKEVHNCCLHQSCSCGYTEMFGFWMAPACSCTWAIKNLHNSLDLQLCRKEIWLGILACVLQLSTQGVSLDSFEADETSEECAGEENESKRISVYITTSVYFLYLLILSSATAFSLGLRLSFHTVHFQSWDSHVYTVFWQEQSNFVSYLIHLCAPLHQALLADMSVPSTSCRYVCTHNPWPEWVINRKGLPFSSQLACSTLNLLDCCVVSFLLPVRGTDCEQGWENRF